MSSGPQQEICLTYTALIDAAGLQNLIRSFSLASNNGVKRIHFLIQSQGGIVNDAIAAYNFIRSLPIEVITYNGGAIASAGICLFLSGSKRKSSATATFMIHPVTGGQASTTANQLEISAKSVAIDDRRLRDIYDAQLKLPVYFDAHMTKGNLDLTAQEALTMNLIDEIRDFKPPAGAQIFNI